MNSARVRAISCAVVSAWLLLGAATAQLAPNQTEGFGKDQILTFTYGQNFSCVTGPFNDLDHNGLIAAVDPNEFQTPHCVVAFTPATTPPGVPVKEIQKLWVIAPFFETNPAEPAFTPELGAALKDLFGFVPDAFKIHPGVAVQCPEPGPPITSHTGAPGTCTMHTSKIDLGPALAALGKVPPGTQVIVPTLNHSHVIDDSLDTEPIWWQIVSVLVTDPAAWPSRDGRTGITSLEKLRQAQANGQARPDSPDELLPLFRFTKTRTPLKRDKLPGADQPRVIYLEEPAARSPSSLIPITAIILPVLPFSAR